MAEPWFFDSTGRLYFVYRAKKWDEVPVRYMNGAEITAVAAVAVKPDGSPITVAGSAAYSAAHEGYLGYIEGASLEDVAFVTIKLTPTVAGGIAPEWAPPRTFDVTVGVTTIADDILLRT